MSCLALAIPSFACHPQATGFCTGNAYFKLIDFSSGLQFEYKYENIDSIITATDSSQVVFWVPQASQGVPVTIEWRYRVGRTNWTAWQALASLTSINESVCERVLPVKFSNLLITRTDQQLNVSFDANESGISYYEIQGSNDGASFEDIGRIQATGSSHYSMSINLLSGVAIASLFFIGFKKKWLFWLSLLLCIGYFSCKKDMITTAKNYNEFRVAAHTFDNNIQYSNVIHLTK